MVTKAEIDTAFESPFEVLEEAREGLSVLLSSLSDFFSASAPALVYDFEAKTGNKLLKVRYPSLPKNLRRKAYRVVTDARHALDQAVFAATICLDGKARGSKTYFPHASSPAQFETLFFGRESCAHVSPRLIPTLRSFEPWPRDPGHVGGNDILKYFLKVSGKNKHEVALTPVPDLQVDWVQNAILTKSIEFSIPPNHVIGTNDFLIAILKPDGTVQFDGSFSYRIGIDKAPSNIHNDAVQILTDIMDIADGLVVTIRDFVMNELL